MEEKIHFWSSKEMENLEGDKMSFLIQTQFSVSFLKIMLKRIIIISGLLSTLLTPECYPEYFVIYVCFRSPLFSQLCKQNSFVCWDHTFFLKIPYLYIISLLQQKISRVSLNLAFEERYSFYLNSMQSIFNIYYKYLVYF